MKDREELIEAVRQRRFDEVVEHVAATRGAMRIVASLVYRDDAELREAAGAALAKLSHRRPRQVQEVVRRLVWAMNDESGTNAIGAPSVLRAIAEERPDLLLPLLPDLMRLCADPGLREPLAEVARLVARHDPRKAVRSMERSLSDCMRGDDDGMHR